MPKAGPGYEGHPLLSLRSLASKTTSSHQRAWGFRSSAMQPRVAPRVKRHRRSQAAWMISRP